MKVQDIGDTTIKHGGRTAVLTVYLNTPASKEQLSKRIQKLHDSKALRGSKMDMVMMTLEIIEEGSSFWENVQTRVVSAIAGKAKA